MLIRVELYFEVLSCFEDCWACSIDHVLSERFFEPRLLRDRGQSRDWNGSCFVAICLLAVSKRSHHSSSPAECDACHHVIPPYVSTTD